MKIPELLDALRRANLDHAQLKSAISILCDQAARHSYFCTGMADVSMHLDEAASAMQHVYADCSRDNV